MWKEFKAFIMRGNVMDLAVGVIIGGAFGKIVTSFVNDVLMPPIGMLLGKVSFDNLFIDLSGTGYESQMCIRDRAGSQDGWPILSSETVISENPDVILLTYYNRDEVLNLSLIHIFIIRLSYSMISEYLLVTVSSRHCDMSTRVSSSVVMYSWGS